MYFNLQKNTTLFDLLGILYEVYQELKYGLCMGLSMMWQAMAYYL
jgi:hypothetical protein